MRSGVFLLLAGLIVSPPVRADDIHGGSDSEWTGGEGQGVEFGSELNPGMAGEGEIPFVPNDVANWFEEYALQKALQDKQNGNGRMDAAEIQNALNPVVIVQKKTVKTSSANNAGVVKTPVVSAVQTTTEKVGSGSSASVSVSQVISPNVIVNVPATNPGPASTEAQAEVEADSREAVRRIQAYNKKVVDNNLGASSGKGGPEASKSSGGLASSWKQFFSSWFSRPSSGSPGGARGGLSRRFEPQESDDVVASDQELAEASSENYRPREISTASSESAFSDMTSSDSWFGWVGWVVAFGLLGTMVGHLRRRTRS